DSLGVLFGSFAHLIFSQLRSRPIQGIRWLTETKVSKVTILISGAGPAAFQLFGTLLPRAKFGPWAGLHIVQQGFLPGKFRMLVEKIFCQKICSAGMAGARDKT